MLLLLWHVYENFPNISFEIKEIKNLCHNFFSKKSLFLHDLKTRP